jgi:hypothetical protein
VQCLEIKLVCVKSRIIEYCISANPVREIMLRHCFSSTVNGRYCISCTFALNGEISCFLYLLSHRAVERGGFSVSCIRLVKGEMFKYSVSS